MSSMEHHGGEHHGYARSVPPEYALLVFVAVCVVALALAWPW
jgi:hypothetical protein